MRARRPNADALHRIRGHALRQAMAMVNRPAYRNSHRIGRHDLRLGIAAGTLRRLGRLPSPFLSVRRPHSEY
jgi:hypothetical protein